jgi:hypothetical protein
MLYIFLFGPMYLVSSDFAMDPKKEQHQILCSFRKSATETLVMNKTSVCPIRKVKNHRDRKRRDRWTAKSRACSSFSLTSLKKFVLPGQIVNPAYCCDVLRRLRGNVRKCAPNFSDKRIGCCISTTQMAAPVPGKYRETCRNECILKIHYKIIFSLSTNLNKTKNSSQKTANVLQALGSYLNTRHFWQIKSIL